MAGKIFWIGFDKRAYDYSHEARELKERYDSRSKMEPMSKLKGGLLGAAIGSIGGGILGMEGPNFLKNLGRGALVGGAAGGILGVIGAIADKIGIDEAKRIMGMRPKEQKEYLRHLARKSEISDAESAQFQRALDKEYKDQGRHEEMMGALKKR